MGVRKQLYEWNLKGLGAFNSDDYPNPGEEVSIFTGGYGNNTTEANLVREANFVVIHQFGSTPGVIVPNVAGDFTATGIINGVNLTGWVPNSFVQVFLDTTGYYQDPQNVFTGGISGEATPYPATAAVRPR